MSECLACRIVEGHAVPPGGVVLRTGRFTVHGLADPTPLPGWVVVTVDRHCRSVAELEAPEAAGLGPLLVRVMQAQKAALGAEHVYVFAIGEVLHHAHVHLVPRYADTPKELWGRACFDAVGRVACAPELVEGALERLRQVLIEDRTVGEP